MTDKLQIMVVDDEEIVRESLSDWLQHAGYGACMAPDGATAIEMARSGNWSAMLVDLKMPQVDGLEVLRQVRSLRPEVPIIIITAYATVDTAVQAMKDGAYDYIVKPFDPEEIGMLLSKIAQHQKLLAENVFLKKELSKRYTFHDLIGKSPAMQEVFEFIRTVAPTRSTVLIEGESGTGKEMLARAIHQSSPRNDGPFVAVSCGALTDTLIEAELFGHEKGAFTGAVCARKGKFEEADGGTLFLDEIAEVGLKCQVDLLRVLQEREVQKVGGSGSTKVDVRIIAATNKNLKEEVKSGRFREDLFYRLNVIAITVPPLRNRREDVSLLATHFLHKYNIECGKSVQRISEDTLAALIEHDWPGNVRELENVVERAVVVAKTNLLTPAELPAHFRKSSEGADDARLVSSLRSLRDVEKLHVTRILADNDWNVQQSAKILQIDRVTLYNKIKKYGLSREK
ncbi:MAG: sigma-54 dependent transcriptional regulator [Planctomycetota bacterium]|nr:sigma-54 dependent transcriptional regulator [Planctomycetota bacterium]